MVPDLQRDDEDREEDQAEEEEEEEIGRDGWTQHYYSIFTASSHIVNYITSS